MARDTLFAVIASVAIHLLLLGVLLFNFSRTPKVASMPEQPEIIQATVLGELVTPVDADRMRREQEQQRLLDEEQRQSAEAQRLLQQEEEQRKAELAVQAEREEQRRQVEQRRENEKAEAEKQRRAEEERKKAEAEKQRRAEEERKKAEAEKQRRAEEERKRAEAERERKAAEEHLKQQMAAEQTQRAQQQRSEWINAYVASITADIQSNWLRPLDAPQDFVCRVKVVQSLTGQVLDVQIIESCGSPLLDRSVENAVRKASPLPPPPDPSVFDREINIRFRP